jgi:hypothetical protein
MPICIVFLLLAAAGSALAAPLVVSLTPSNYKSLLVSGQKVGKETFGTLYNRDGKPIMANDYEVRTSFATCASYTNTTHESD